MPLTKVEGGFTAVPNVLIESTAFNDTDKLVLINLLRHAMGKDEAWPSKLRIARQARKGRAAVKESLARLTALGCISEAGAAGNQRTKYRIHLDRIEHVHQCKVVQNDHLERMTSRTEVVQNEHLGGPERAPKVVQNDHKADKAEKTKQKDGSATPEGSSLTDVGDDAEFGFANAASSAASPLVAIASNGEGDDKPVSHALGNEEPEATLPVSSGRFNGLQSGRADRPLVRAEVNAAFVRPDGYRVSDDFDELECDLNLTLAQVYGEPLNRGTLDKLVKDHGVRRCALWAHWLPRKLASDFEKGKLIEKPTARYVRAVQEGWEVDPKWPEFDEQRHTVKAREEAEKRKQARDGSESPLSDDTSVTDEFEEVFSGSSAGAHNAEVATSDDAFSF